MTAPKYYYNLNRCISDGKTQFDTTNMPKETYEVNGQIYYGSNDLMDLLNEQHETIQRLKQNIDELLSVNVEEELLKENEQLKKAYAQLKHRHSLLHDVCIDAECDRDSYRKDIASLEKENEQLKNKIDVLEDDNETYHKSLEKLNLYTKRFIPTKCTNEFKDCKTNRYYWLDHEGNFEGCLELLNLLDCENEILKSENSHLKAKLMVYEEQIKGDVE